MAVFLLNSRSSYLPSFFSLVSFFFFLLELETVCCYKLINTYLKHINIYCFVGYGFLLGGTFVLVLFCFLELSRTNKGGCYKTYLG